MRFLANLALFFVAFLPLTFVVGLPFGFFVGPNQQGDEAYPFFTWLVVVLQLVLPGLLVVPIVHVALRLARRKLSPAALRRGAVAAMPLGLLAAHVAAWGTVVVSVPLLVIVCVPGTIYGALFRLP